MKNPNENNRLTSPIYMSDMKSDLKNHAFFGKGTEELMKKAREENKEVIVGRFFDTPYIDE